VLGEGGGRLDSCAFDRLPGQERKQEGIKGRVLLYWGSIKKEEQREERRRWGNDNGGEWFKTYSWSPGNPHPESVGKKSLLNPKKDGGWPPLRKGKLPHTEEAGEKRSRTRKIQQPSPGVKKQEGGHLTEKD